MTLRPYIEGGVRPAKLRLKTQTATEEILTRTYSQTLTNIKMCLLIKKCMTEEETQI